LIHIASISDIIGADFEIRPRPTGLLTTARSHPAKDSGTGLSVVAPGIGKHS